jgi:hypothetical protein
LNNIKALTILLIVGAKIVINYAKARGWMNCFWGWLGTDYLGWAVDWIVLSEWLIELNYVNGWL